jgi:hypothetical protein
MREDFSMVVDQELFPMILLDPLPQAQMLTGGDLDLGVLTCHLALLMVVINLVFILLVMQCLGFPFLHIMEALHHNHTPFLLVVLYMGLLELFLRYHIQEAEVLGLGVGIPVHP